MITRELITSIEIDASPHRVWEIMTEFEHFERWNPFILSIEGAAIQGAKLKLEIQPPEGNSMMFPVVITLVDTDRELRWLGRLIFSGIFDSEHRFEIERLSDRQVKFVQSEYYSGLLVPLLWRRLDTQIRRGFEEMNQALKLRAEETG